MIDRGASIPHQAGQSADIWCRELLADLKVIQNLAPLHNFAKLTSTVSGSNSIKSASGEEASALRIGRGRPSSLPGIRGLLLLPFDPHFEGGSRRRDSEA
jgi:hypothetical protein